MPVSEPNVTYLDDRHLYVWGDPENCEINLERFKEERDGSIRAEVTVSAAHGGAGHLLGPSRLNLLSDRSIKMMANTLGEIAARDAGKGRACIGHRVVCAQRKASVLRLRQAGRKRDAT